LEPVVYGHIPCPCSLNPSQREFFNRGLAEHLIVKAIKTYPTRVEADLARIALYAAGIPSVVVGIGVGMEGGMAGVQLLVPDDRVGSGAEGA
jgi:hypothetical protein